MPANKGRRMCWTFLLVVAFATMSIFKYSVTLPKVQELRTSANEVTPATKKPAKEKSEPFLLPQATDPFRPVTNIVRDCDPTPNQPLHSIRSFPDYTNHSNFFKTIPLTPPADNDSSKSSQHLAVCKFVAKDNAMHFAHTMQQLYGCHSFWQANNRMTPVLVMPSKSIQTKVQRNAFLKGFFELLKDSSLGLEIMLQNQYKEKYNNTTLYNIHIQTIDVSGGYILTHAEELAQLARENRGNKSHPTLPHSACNTSPRIGLLNRRKSVGRSVVNVEKIVEALPKDYNLTVEYFEDKSFQEQVDFFASMDILLSPHGAQLTGLPYMAQSKKCSRLLELFPKGYAIPSFYGSLAANAGIGYSYLYLSDQPWQQEQAESLSQRIQARAADLCPSPNVVAISLQSLVQEWRECCQRKLDR